MTMAIIQARCAVCGSELAAKVRACGTCETLYHPDCWSYNDGCAIFGCRSAGAPARGTAKGDPASTPHWARRAAFGALLGTAVMAAPFAVMEPVRFEPELFYWVACAAVLGAVSGILLRGRHDGRRIALLGLLGPGTAAWAIVLPLALLHPGDKAGLAFALPLYALGGMIASPLAVPCAIVAARYNDPELATPARQARWLAAAFACAAVLFGLMVARICEGR